MVRINNFIRFVRFLVYKAFFPSRIQSAGKNLFSCGQLAIQKDGVLSLGSDNVVDRCFDWEIQKGRLSIGSRNYFNKNVKIACFDKITIGDDCLIADSVHFYDHNHSHSQLGKPIRSQGYSTRPIKVGNNVWIGAKATILKGVTIGDGAIIGANAVVTKDIPANAVAVGNPANVVKMRGHGKGK